MAARTKSKHRFALAIHGGAGTLPRAQMRPQREARYRTGLERALRAGYDVLHTGGSSVDAVTAAVVVLEDDPLFNAGRGAVLNEAGAHELDASIMDGATLRAGAVAAARRIRNPVLAARAVMEKSPHVMLAGAGADAFARKKGLELVAPDYFTTRQRLVSLELALLRKRGRLSSKATAAEKHGTVGAVALDSMGNLAAATSTGGFTNKMVGRVGDTPIIGAGTYANNETCAVSGTGDGEFFIRGVLGHNVSARMRYLHESPSAAARAALAEVAALGGLGGLIAVDRRGRIAMPFTTEGMYRGYVLGNGKTVVSIFR
ncbi:MAG TPA: isoaspartyl peptidase/L-asparaginase [Burkholderiales bacterium]|nr:isoaspartyl peptidase/L-asparaginase [Burkholderiales bacterium]